jgi:hypothetical protein
MKRYTVMHFPSLYGTPFETNSWLLSRIVAFSRLVRFATEVRIVDELTGDHLVW